MGTPLHGKDGVVTVGGSTVALVNEWKADIGAEPTDVTSLDSGGWQRRIPGIKACTGNIDVRYCTDDASGVTVLMNSAVGGSVVTLALKAGGTAKSLSGSAYLSASLDNPHDDVAAVSFDFESDGPWTYS